MCYLGHLQDQYSMLRGHRPRDILYRDTPHVLFDIKFYSSFCMTNSTKNIFTENIINTLNTQWINRILG